MPSSLLQQVIAPNVMFYEYDVSFSTPLFPSDIIYIGLDYSNNNILAEFNNEQIVIGQIPYTLNPLQFHQLIITLEVNGVNNTVIPYTFYFDFSSDGSLTASPRNAFLQVLPRPTLTASLDFYTIFDNEPVNVTYASDANYVEIEVLKFGNVLFQQHLNLPPSGVYQITDLQPALYIIRVRAYNEPLLFDEVLLNLEVLAGVKNVFIASFVNTNIIGDFEIIKDTLPYILTTTISYIGRDQVRFCYTTENATKVDIITTFGQDFYDQVPNNCVLFQDLQLNTLYEFTIVARDDDGDVDTRQLNFQIVDDMIVQDDQTGVDNKMTFSVSAGVYTKETDLGFIAEQFVGTHGSFAGKFTWGPCLERVRVAKEEDLVQVFQKPSTNLDNAIDFLTAASFLNYSSALDVVRIANYNGTIYLNKNSVVKPFFNTVNTSANAESDITVLNDEQYTNMLDGDLENNTFMARYTGEIGNSLGLSFVVASDHTDFNQLTNGFYYTFGAIADVDTNVSRDNFLFSRAKFVSYRRVSVSKSARSILDLGDWLELNGDRYQIRNIVLGVDNQVTGVIINDGGTDFTVAPTLAFTGGGGTGATATATLSTTGGIREINVVSGGTGYTTATVTITGNGVGATAVANIIGGAIDTIAVTSAGSGYSGTVTATITGDGTGATATVILGYSIASVTVTNSGAGYTTVPTITVTGNGINADLTAVVNSIDSIELDRIYRGIVSTGSHSVNSTITPFNVVKAWRFSDAIAAEPVSNQLHIIVFDAGGKFSGVAGSILERYTNMSFDATSKNEDGTTNFYLDRINAVSQYIRIGTKDIGDISQTLLATDLNALGKEWVTNYIRLGNGDDAFSTMGLDDDITGYDLYKDPEQCDAPIIIGNYRSVKNESGVPNTVLASYLLQNIAETRRDSMVYLSCRRESVVNNPKNEVREILRDVALLPSTSYGEFDSGWKYTYDRYNDRYIWIPTSGDHAGCYARTDRTNESWFSGAGEQRGKLKSVVKLAFNPNETQRDQLYANRVNPVITLPNVGTILFGDKSLLSSSSSFNRIPTRRLFIVLEKTIANACRFALFEFNDSILQNQVRTVIEGYLSEVKSRRGIEDYRVIVDETVNTPQVIGNNQFKGRILIKPKYSINFIELNFVNVASILTFEESVALL